jgi:hypothetical protein
MNKKILVIMDICNEEYTIPFTFSCSPLPLKYAIQRVAPPCKPRHEMKTRIYNKDRPMLNAPYSLLVTNRAIITRLINSKKMKENIPRNVNAAPFIIFASDSSILSLQKSNPEFSFYS